MTDGFAPKNLRVIVMAALAAGYPAWAQETASTTPEDGANEAGAKEGEVIYVYAQKRKQASGDVALAVTSLDGEDLEKWRIKDSVELSGLAPNIKFTSNAGEGTPPAFNIRGVGMFDYNSSAISPVGLYLDEVPTGSASHLAASLLDMERVEILRGPQGTLFGRNTTGGAVLLMSREPEDEFGGFVRLGYGEHDHKTLQGALNLPVDETTAVRLAVGRQDYQFSTHNLFPGGSDGGLRQDQMRLSLKTEWDQVKLVARVYAEDWEGKPKPIGSLGVWKDFGAGQMCSPGEVGSDLCFTSLGFQIGSDDYWDVIADTQDKRHDSELFGASLKVEWQMSDALFLKSLTGYRNLDRFHSWDSDGPGNFIEGSLGTDSEVMSQEFSLGVEGDHYYWVNGVFFVREELRQENDIDIFRDFRAIPELAFIPAQFFYHNRIDNESVALYSQVDFELSQDLTLTTGLRYTRESTDYHAVSDLDTVAFQLPGFWDLDGSLSDNDLSGKLALNYRLTRQASVYGSYSRGYKSGGYNGGYSTSPEQAMDSEYEAERLDAYEIGAKLSLWEQSARLNLAAFYYDYQDQQAFVNITTGFNPYHVLKNVGDSKIYGFEAELRLAPADDWQWDLNLGHIPHAKLGEYRQGDIVVSDNRLPFTSEWTVGTRLYHEMPLAGGLLLGQLGYQYQSDFYFDQYENPYTRQDGYGLWDARLAYQWSNGMELALWGKNLGNSEYAELLFDSIAPLGAVTELKGESRRVGVEFNYRF
ncbi:MAG: TonB-dependent receptor [Gammaproteobacteria bacterium]|nr:TonB-dependent receptor [Gammaproteobacteria bacterium]